MAGVAGGRGLRFACAAVAFGCLLVYCFVFSAGFAGDALSLTHAQRGAAALSCSAGRLLVFAAFAAAGSLGVRVIDRETVVSAGVAGIAAVLVPSVGSGALASVVAGLLAGMSSGIGIFALVLLLSDEPVRGVVLAGAAGLAVSAVLAGLFTALPPAALAACLVLAAAGSAACLVLADPDLGFCRAGGEFGRDERRRFPWFASVMLISCGMLGCMLYGSAEAFGWSASAEPDLPVMALAALSVTLLTLGVMVVAGNWTQLVWVPLFALLFSVLVLMCTSPPVLGPFALDLILAIAVAFRFLSWMVLPAIVSTSLLPRYFTAGMLLAFSSSFMGPDLGFALAGIVPAGLHEPGSFAGVAALTLVLVLAVVVLADRAGRMAEYEESAELPASRGDDGDRNEAPSFEQRCAVLADAARLTAREREIFAMTARGYSSTYIAEQLVISSSTVRFHQQNVYRKLDVHSKQELINLVEDRSA